MQLVETIILLFIVVDPFGNLPFIIAILEKLDTPRYHKAILREIAIAFFVLCLFLFAGDTILEHLNIRQSSVRIAGGIILLIIALQMIFRTASEMFQHEYQNDPLIVPISMPSIAGPSAITTVIILKTDHTVSTLHVLAALAVVFGLTLTILYIGRFLVDRLGPRVLRALEKFMGMLLSLIAVDMIMLGIRDILMASI
jgi:multiple antibiotic resistance protein